MYNTKMNTIMYSLLKQLNNSDDLLVDIVDVRKQLDDHQLVLLNRKLRRDNIGKGYLRMPSYNYQLASAISYLNGVRLVMLTGRNGKRYLQFRGFRNDTILATTMLALLTAHLKALAYKGTPQLKWDLLTTWCTTLTNKAQARDNKRMHLRVRS